MSLSVALYDSPFGPVHLPDPVTCHRRDFNDESVIYTSGITTQSLERILSNFRLPLDKLRVNPAAAANNSPVVANRRNHLSRLSAEIRMMIMKEVFVQSNSELWHGIRCTTVSSFTSPDGTNTDPPSSPHIKITLFPQITKLFVSRQWFYDGLEALLKSTRIWIGLSGCTIADVLLACRSTCTYLESFILSAISDCERCSIQTRSTAKLPAILGANWTVR